MGKIFGNGFRESEILSRITNNFHVMVSFSEFFSVFPDLRAGNTELATNFCPFLLERSDTERTLCREVAFLGTVFTRTTAYQN